MVKLKNQSELTQIAYVGAEKGRGVAGVEGRGVLEATES
jgi:hypothetical protein